MAIVWLTNAKSVSEVAHAVAVSRSTVNRWFQGGGIAGCERGAGGCAPSLVSLQLLEALQDLMEDSP